MRKEHSGRGDVYILFQTPHYPANLPETLRKKSTPYSQNSPLGSGALGDPKNPYGCEKPALVHAFAVFRLHLDDLYNTQPIKHSVSITCHLGD